MTEQTNNGHKSVNQALHENQAVEAAPALEKVENQNDTQAAVSEDGAEATVVSKIDTKKSNVDGLSNLKDKNSTETVEKKQFLSGKDGHLIKGENVDTPLMTAEDDEANDATKVYKKALNDMEENAAATKENIVAAAKVCKEVTESVENLKEAKMDEKNGNNDQDDFMKKSGLAATKESASLTQVSREPTSAARESVSLKPVSREPRQAARESVSLPAVPREPTPAAESVSLIPVSREPSQAARESASLTPVSREPSPAARESASLTSVSREPSLTARESVSLTPVSKEPPMAAGTTASR